MVMGSLPEQVDLAVVGGGVGGYTTAIRAAELGMSVAIVERDKIGGACPNYACIPSKALIYMADLFYKMKNSERFGISADGVSVDLKKMYDWRMSVSKRLEDGVAYLCKANGIDVFKAEGTFLSSNSLQLSNGITLEFKKAVIATGSVPNVLPGFEFNDYIIDYKKALMLDHLPKSMAIIGAGFVAVETGTLYTKLGCKVSIIARSSLLSSFDPDAVAIVQQRLEGLGVKVYANATPVSSMKGSLKLSSGETVDSEIVVVATGLSPYTKGLGLENTKVELDEKGFVVVDKRLQTTDPAIYAVGDVAGVPMLAHKAIRQGVVVAEAISGNGSYDNTVVPAVVFSDPEIAVAGEVRPSEGITITKFPFSAIGRSIALDTTVGFVKIASDKNGVVRGVEIVSDDANALISEAALAIEMGATLEDIADTIHPHPTYSEALQEAAEAALGRPIHFFYGKHERKR
jgi:dihydrolipoamide dehydrogenase